MKLQTAGAIFAAAALAGGFAPRPDRQPVPAWWEMILLIKTEGEYRVTDPGMSFSGTYRFVVCWKGRLDQDMEDYLLARFQCDLAEWTLSETPSGEGEFRKLTQENSEAKPVFNLKYVLKIKDVLTFDFITEGFQIPLNPYAEKFPLILPSSEENLQRRDAIDYNALIATGSNRIVIPEEALFRGRVEKSFFWTWKNKDWIQRQNKAVYSSNRHRATVTITIIPHEK